MKLIYYSVRDKEIKKKDEYFTHWKGKVPTTFSKLQTKNFGISLKYINQLISCQTADGFSVYLGPPIE